MLDSPDFLGRVVQLFRTARKRNSSVWGISQALEDFVGTYLSRALQGPGIVRTRTQN